MGVKSNEGFMSKYLVLIFLFLSFGCTIGPVEKGLTSYSFKSAEYSIPVDFIVYEEKMDAVDSPKGRFGNVYVESGNSEEELKTYIAVIVHEYPDESLKSINCDYSIISKLIEEREISSIMLETHKNLKNKNIKRLSSTNFILSVTKESGDIVEYQFLVDGGVLVNVVIYYKSGSIYESGSELGRLVNESIQVTNSSVCKDRLLTKV